MLTAKVCPSGDGKRYVSVLVDLPPDDAPREELSGKTWVRLSSFHRSQVSGNITAFIKAYLGVASSVATTREVNHKLDLG